MTDLLKALWGLVLNRPLVWLARDGSVTYERYRRAERWAITRPGWTFYVLTTGPGCGCRRRFGLWRTIICSPHMGLRLDDE